MNDLEERGQATGGRVNAAGLALRDDIGRAPTGSASGPGHLGPELTQTYLDLVEPVGDRLVARIDATAGPEWMPAARHRRTDLPPALLPKRTPDEGPPHPDERFEALPGFDFEPHYADVADGGAGRWMHYLDEGPADGPVVLLMHGEPSWCYLYRTMIPELVDAGLRCIAPDLVGFGRSDKPAERDDYTYARHVEWVRALVLDVLGLDDVTFFGQDWGGLVGLRVVAENPDRFARVAIGTPACRRGASRSARRSCSGSSSRRPRRTSPSARSSHGLQTRCRPRSSRRTTPFPDDSAGARVFLMLVPTSAADPASAANLAARAVLRRGTSRSSPSSPTRTRSPGAVSGGSRRTSPVPPTSRTRRRSPAAATSSRRTAAPRSLGTWRRSSGA